MQPGATTTRHFRVRNLGSAATFQIIAVDAHGFVTRGGTGQVTLQQGASATVEVDPTVPSDAPPGTGVTLTITATSTFDPDISDGTAIEMTVAGE